jgi:hypothetical protein
MKTIAFIAFQFRNEENRAPGVVVTETVEVVESDQIARQGNQELEEALEMAKGIQSDYPAVPLAEIVMGVLTDWYHMEYLSENENGMLHLAWALTKFAGHPYLVVMRDGTTGEVRFQAIEADDYFDGKRRVLKYLTLPETLEPAPVCEEVVVDGVARIVGSKSLMKH